MSFIEDKYDIMLDDVRETLADLDYFSTKINQNIRIAHIHHILPKRNNF